MPSFGKAFFNMPIYDVRYKLVILPKRLVYAKLLC